MGFTLSGIIGAPACSLESFPLVKPDERSFIQMEVWNWVSFLRSYTATVCAALWQPQHQAVWFRHDYEEVLMCLALSDL